MKQINNLSSALFKLSLLPLGGEGEDGGGKLSDSPLTSTLSPLGRGRVCRTQINKKPKVLTYGFIFCWLAFTPSILFSANEEMRDPFQASVSAPRASSSVSIAQPARMGTVTLEGISIGPKGAFAVISGEVYLEGEEKNGVKVVKIHKKKVDILNNGIPEALRIVPETAMGKKLEKANPLEPTYSEKKDCISGGQCL